MGLPESTCWALLHSADRAVLSTLHPFRGADLVPVVFAVVDGQIVIPIDTVKPKSTTSLQRLTNIAADPRVTILADHYDASDWTQLWWVRAHGTAIEAAPTDAQRGALGSKYAPYADPSVISSVIVVAVAAITGWRASVAPRELRPFPEN